MNNEISEQNGVKAWFVVISSALFFFYIFIQINMFNAIGPSLIQTFHVTTTTLGQLSAIYFYANVICLFPAGLYLDQFSTRRLLLIVTLLTAMATAIFGAADFFWEAAFARVVVGITGSFCLIACVKMTSRWFTPKRMALVTGVFVTLAMAGGVVAQTPFVLLINAVGWREAMYWNAGLGILILAFIFILSHDYPKGYNISAEKEHAKHQLKFWIAIRRVLKNPQNYLTGLYTSLINLPIFLLGALWGSLYLMQAEGLTHAQSTMVTAMLFVGSMIGCPVLGWVSDKMGRRRRPMIIGAILSLLVILVIIYVPNLTFGMLMFLFFFLGFITSIQVIGYPVLVESNPLSLTARAQGFSSILIMAGGFTQPLFAWLMNLHWDHRMLNGLPIYTKANFHWGMSIIPIAFIIGLIIALCVRETHCQHYREEK